MPRTMLVGLLSALALLCFATPALALDALPAAVPAPAGDHGLDAKACAALGMGVAGLGGALGQGRAAAAAFEGIGRNPGASVKMQNALILGLALIESVVLIAVVGCIFLQKA